VNWLLWQFLAIHSKEYSFRKANGIKLFFQLFLIFQGPRPLRARGGAHPFHTVDPPRIKLAINAANMHHEFRIKRFAGNFTGYDIVTLALVCSKKCDNPVQYTEATSSTFYST
jgi:hypothetical protein